MNSIIISVHPKFARAILDGHKKIELRRRIGSRFESGAKLYIYSTAPDMAIVGSAIIERVWRFDVYDEISVRKIANESCISVDALIEYFQGVEYGHAIFLEGVVAFSEIISLGTLRSYSFSPPQSYSYPGHDLVDLLEMAL